MPLPHRQDLERPASADPVDVKVAIDSENSLGSMPFCEQHQRRIGEFHRDIGVPRHQAVQIVDVGIGDRQDRDRAAFYESPNGIPFMLLE